MTDCGYWAMDYYTKEFLASTYMEPIYPVPSESEWVVPENHVPLLPPHMDKRQAGRPRENKRIPSRDEVAAPSVCTRCHATGHKTTSCKQPPKSLLSSSRNNTKTTNVFYKSQVDGPSQSEAMTVDLDAF